MCSLRCSIGYHKTIFPCRRKWSEKNIFREKSWITVTSIRFITIHSDNRYINKDFCYFSDKWRYEMNFIVLNVYPDSTENKYSLKYMWPYRIEKFYRHDRIFLELLINITFLQENALNDSIISNWIWLLIKHMHKMRWPFFVYIT